MYHVTEYLQRLDPHGAENLTLTNNLSIPYENKSDSYAVPSDLEIAMSVELTARTSDRNRRYGSCLIWNCLDIIAYSIVVSYEATLC